jgi:hypothetical protein
LNVDEAVEKIPELNPMTEVVALYPTPGVNGKANVENPASLLNQDSFTDDEAIVCVRPFDPVKRKPCVRDGRKNVELNVDEAVEKIPELNPMTEVVALYPTPGVNGKVNVENPASLLNQDSFTDDEAIVCVRPFDPVKRKPCVRDGRKNVELNVDEAVEKIPELNPMTEVVALYPTPGVNGNENPPSEESVRQLPEIA